MQIVFSNSINNEDSVIINNIISAIFKTKNIDLTSFSISRTFFVSNNPEDKADFYININTFLNDNTSYKMILLKNFANAIFGEYVDPREIIGNYGTINKNTETSTPPPIPQPIIDHSPTIENLEEVKQTEPQTDTIQEVSHVIDQETPPQDIFTTLPVKDEQI
jgi:hypothetical protein